MCINLEEKSTPLPRSENFHELNDELMDARSTECRRQGDPVSFGYIVLPHPRLDEIDTQIFGSEIQDEVEGNIASRENDVCQEESDFYE